MFYKIVAYIRVEGDPEDYVYFSSAEEAEAEAEHLRFMQDENIYVVEEVDPDDLPDEPEIMDEHL